MSDVIDSRIVEMQFDSKDFDRNIQKSQKTLEDFKKTLNFDDASKQMENFAKSSDLLVDMAANIRKLTNNFAGIGDVATEIEKKIHKAWTGAARSIEQFGKSLTTVQAQRGFSDKYQGLLKSVQTITNSIEEDISESGIYAVMQNLMHYADETSYDFADMAKNIGKFTTAGVRLEDAELEMEGIANWAALAGQGVPEAQRAMYNISQAMQAGAMRLIDYRSIQNAAMDTRQFRKEAIKAAASVGSLQKKGDKYYTKKGNKEVNVDNFAETLQYKWFNKAAMEKVFKEFGDQTTEIGKKAYAAAQRCITFSDALNAIKDMLSTGWMQTYQHIFGKLSEAMAIFSGMCNKVEASLLPLMELRNGILEWWNISGGRDSLWSMILGETETPDGEILFKGAFGLLDVLDGLGKLFEGAFRDFVGNFIKSFNIGKYESDPTYLYQYLGELLATLTERAQEFVNGVKAFFTEIPKGMSESRFDQIRHIVEAIYHLGLLTAQVFGGIVSFIGSILSQFEPTFHALLTLISYIAQLFSGDVVGATKSNAIGNWFNELAATFAPFARMVNGFVTFIVNIIGKLLEWISSIDDINIFGFIGDVITRFTRALNLLFEAFYGGDTIASKLTTIMSILSDIPAGEGFTTLTKNIKEFVKGTWLFQTIWPTLSKYVSKEKLKSWWESFKGYFTNLETEIPAKIQKLKDKVAAGFELFKGVVKLAVTGEVANLKEKVKAFVESFSIFKQILPLLTKYLGVDKATTIWNTVKQYFTNLTEKLPEYIEKAKNKVASTVELVASAIEFAFTGKVENLKKNVKATAKSIWASITSIVTNIRAKIPSYVTAIKAQGAAWLTKITTALTPVVTELKTKIWPLVKKAVKSVWASFEKFITDLSVKLPGYVATAKTTIKGWINKIIAAVSPIIGKVVTKLWPLTKKIASSVWTIVKSSVKDLIAKLPEYIATVKTTVKNFATKTTTSLKPALTNALNKIKPKLKAYMTQLFTYLKASMISFGTKLPGYLAKAKTIVTTAATTLYEVFKPTIDLLLTKIKTKLKEVTTTLWSSIKSFVTNFGTNLPTYIENAKTTVKAFIDMLTTLVKSIATSEYSNLKSKIKSLLKSLTILKKLPQLLKKSFGTEKAKVIWESMKALFDNFTDKLPGYIELAKAKIKSVLGKGLNLVETIIGWLLGGISSSAKAEDAPEEIGEMITQTLASEETQAQIEDAIVEAIVPDDDGTTILGAIKNAFSGIFEKIKTFFTTLTTTTLPAIKEKFNQIKDFFAGFDWEKAFGNVMDFLKIWASIKWAGSISNIGKGIGKFGKGMGTFSKNFKYFQEGLSGVGNGIGSIGAGIKAIGEGFKEKGFKGMFDNFMTFTDSFNTTTTNIQKNKNITRNLFGFGAQLLMIAGAVWVIVDALNKLKGVKLEEVKEPAIIIVGIIGTLLIAAGLAKLFAGNGFAFITLAGAVAIILYVMTQLMSIQWDNMVDSVFKLVVIAGTLVAVAQMASGVQIKGMIGLSVAVGILAGVVYLLGKMDEGVAWSGISRLIPIMFMLKMFVASAGKNNFSGVKGMAGLAFSIMLLVIPIKMLGNMDTGAAVQGVLAIGAILLALGIFLNKTKDVDKASKIAGLVGSVAALALLAVILGNMPFDKALQGVGSIAALLFSISYLVKQVAKLNDNQLNNVSKVFKSIAFVIAIAAGAIAILGSLNIGWELAGAFFGGMAIMVAAVGKALPALSQLSLGKALKGILILGLAVAALSAVFSLVAPMIMDSIGEGIALFFKKLGGAGSDITKFISAFSSTSEGSISDVGSKIKTLFEIVKTLGDFSKYRDSVNSFRIQLNNLRAALMLFMNNESSIGSFAGSNIQGLLVSLRDLLPSLATIKLGNLPNKIALLGSGISLFYQTTADVGSPDDSNALKFIERLFQQAGNIETLSKLPLNSMSDKMSKLGGAISIYATSASQLGGVEVAADPKTIETGVSMLEAVCAAISGEDGNGGFKIPENMPEEGKIAGFGAELAALGTALSKFISACQWIGDKTDAGVTALTTLGTLNRELTEDKLKVADVFGKAGVDESILGEFANCIGLLGEALASFATMSVNRDYSAGLAALDALAAINTKLTEDTVEVFTVLPDNQVTESTLSTFAGDIGSLGNALSAFATAVNFVNENGTLDDDKVSNFNNAVDALSKFGDMAAKMPKIGGLVGWITGRTKGLDEFGDEIEDLGNGLTKFSAKINGLPPAKEGEDGTPGFEYSDRIKNALSVLTDLVKIEGDIPEEHKIDGLTQRIEGHVKGLDDIGKEIGFLGDGLVTFSNKLNGIPEGGGDGKESLGFQYTKKVRDALSVLKSLLTIQDSLPEERIGGLQALINGEAQTLTTLSGDIASLGSALRTFSVNLTGTDGLGTFNLDTVLGALTAVNMLVDTASKLVVVNPETEGIFGVGWYVNTLSGLFDMLNSQDFGIASKVATFATELSQAFAESGSISMAALTGFSSITSGLSQLASIGAGSEFKVAGETIANQITVGLSSAQETVLSTVTTLADAINNAFLTNIDTTPTISPVLDTTQLETDIANFNTGGVSLNLPSTLDVTVTNPVDLTPVTSAIAALQTQVSELGTAISNIRIVLNSGPLVGGIAGDMDNLLGRRGTFAARRNAVPNNP